MDQFKYGPSMVTIEFFSAGSRWSLEFLGPKMSSFVQIWKVFSKTVIISYNKSAQKCTFGFYLLIGNYTNEVRFKRCQKSNIFEKNMVAYFGFNCKNGNSSPILRLHPITRAGVIF